MTGGSIWRNLIYSLIWQSVMWRPGKGRVLIGMKNPLPIRPAAIASQRTPPGPRRSPGSQRQPGYALLPSPTRRHFLIQIDAPLSPCLPRRTKGLDVLRALLKRFYCYLTGECFPSYDQIAEAAGCSRSTVAAKLRILEQLGIIQTIRRKVVASFTSRVHRVRFDVAVQTSNSYVFNLPITDRSQHEDLGLPLLQLEKARVSAVKEAESKIRAETSKVLESRDVADLTAEKERWIQALLGTDKAG